MLHNTLQQEDSSNVHIGDTVFNISRDVGILIYNRVPKSGSTTVNNILSDLSKRHRFSTFMSGAYASHSMPTSKAMCFHPYLLPDARIEVVTRDKTHDIFSGRAICIICDCRVSARKGTLVRPPHVLHWRREVHWGEERHDSQLVQLCPPPS